MKNASTTNGMIAARRKFCAAARQVITTMEEFNKIWDKSIKHAESKIKKAA